MNIMLYTRSSDGLALGPLGNIPLGIFFQSLILIKLGMGHGSVPWVWVLMVKTLWRNFLMNEAEFSKTASLANTAQVSIKFHMQPFLYFSCQF